MQHLSDRAWSANIAGEMIGLLHIPTILPMHIALGALSSFVTAGAKLGRHAFGVDFLAP